MESLHVHHVSMILCLFVFKWSHRYQCLPQDRTYVFGYGTQRHIIEANVPKYEGAVLYCTHGYLFCRPHFNSGTGCSACHAHHGINHMKTRTLIFIKKNMSIQYCIFLYIICFFFFSFRFKDNKIFIPFLSFFAPLKDYIV